MQYPSVDNSPFNREVNVLGFCSPQKNKSLVSEKKIKITLKARNILGSWDIRALNIIQDDFYLLSHMYEFVC